MNNNFLCCLPLDVLGKIMGDYIGGNNFFSCVYLSKQLNLNIEKMLSTNIHFMIHNDVRHMLIDAAFMWFTGRMVSMKLKVERNCILNVKCTSVNGKLNSLNDEPSCETESYRMWHRNGMLHRKYGPAYECDSGTNCWYYKGKLHRDGGLPAKEYSNGRKEWYKHGVLQKIEHSNVL